MTVRDYRRKLIAGFAALLGVALVVDTIPAHAEVELLRSGYPHEALYDIAIAGERGLAVGMPALVLATADGGRSWTPEQIDSGGLALLGVAISGEHAIAVGQMGRIYRREGASGWIGAESGTGERLLSVAIDKGGLAVATGAFGTILLSRDHGASWASISPSWLGIGKDDAEPHINAVSLGAGGVITVAGEFGLVMRSSDLGRNWQVLAKGDATIFGLYLDSEGRGAAVGQNGTVLVSAGWDAPWRRIETGHSENFLDVWVDGSGRMTVTGLRVLLIGKGWGARWTAIKNKDIATGWYQGVAARDEAIGAPLVVGHDARILKVGD